MAALQKITASMYPDIRAALLSGRHPKIAERPMQKAFAAHGWCDEDHFGYALIENGKVVGLLGMIFSERRLAGKPARFCNLHSWYVEPEYRAKSLLLLKPVLNLKDVTITDFSPTSTAAAIGRRLGFKTLDRTATVLPLPLSRGVAAADVCDMTGEAGRYAAKVTDDDLRTYCDHQDIDCRHLLAESRGTYCYVVYSRVERRLLPYACLHYVSNPRFFAEYHRAIRRHVARRSGCPCAVIDARLLQNVRVPNTFQVPSTDKLYRSHELLPQQIDGLYSEMVLFKLPTMLTLYGRVRRSIQSLKRPTGRIRVSDSLET